MEIYAQKTRDELISIFKERKIKGYSKMKKEELIQRLSVEPETKSVTVSSVDPDTIRFILWDR